MRVALTGTPGTGKTTVAELVDADLEVVHLNDVVRKEGLHDRRDPERGSLVADLEALEARLASRDDLLVESHLAHHLPADRAIVLRCNPRELRERLLAREDGTPTAGDQGTERPGTAPVDDADADSSSTAGEPGSEPAGGSDGALERSARENAEAEALDVVLSEAVDAHGLERVYEIDTTDRTPEAVAADVEAVIDGDREPSAGELDFTDYL